MRAQLTVVFALALGCTACGDSGSINANGGGPTWDSNGVIVDGNTVFSIPTVTGGNVTATPPPPPAVQNFTIMSGAYVQNGVANGIAGSSANLVLNSTANDACNDANSSTYHVGEVQLAIRLVDLPDGTVTPNTYGYPSSTTSPYQINALTYAVVDTPCYYNSLNIQSGTVTVTSAGSQGMAGSYTLTFSGGTINGNFSVTEDCNALAAPPTVAATCH